MQVIAFVIALLLLMLFVEMFGKPPTGNEV